ncbi:MAG: DNA gyrase subunit A [Bacteroidia bacterium]|nr:DNA gyrase subunit A [Bacteroidia bacterium]
MAGEENIIQVSIEEQMKTAYIDYSMSVIVSRALPDVRDGLKPVHRRVLYGMLDLGLAAAKPHKKSARIVGEVLGKYHPHGDTSVYDSMVRLAQHWSVRYPMVDGQGNFGSIDGDPPAAMRYTEARLTKMAEEMLADINKDTVEYQLNFDDSLKEPTVLPARIPNLLVNGASGIAVGMATNMAPHNLSEIVDATIGYIENNDITIEELSKIVKAPDFPTGGTIYGYAGVKEAFETGRGRIVIRAKTTLEENKDGRTQIIVTEIPYQVNKSTLIAKTADYINDKKIEGISDIRDESDKDGLRIVYELKRDAIPNIVLNNLFKYTDLQNSFNINNIALVKGRPQQLNLKDLIKHFVDHRHDVLVRKSKYELEEAEKRAHILEGYLIALDNLDAVIKLIRASKDADEAKEGLMTSFQLSDLQAKAILEMRLQRLTGLERDKIKKEYEEVQQTINFLRDVLSDEELRMDILKDDLKEIKEQYGDERRSDIEYYADDNFNIEDIIPDEQVVLTISHMGYIKRTLSEAYRTQGRGGKGAKGSTTRDEDFIEHLFIATTHNYLLFFTEQGRCFWIKVHQIPEGGRIHKGRAIQNLINIPPEDKVKAFIAVKSLTDEDYLDNHYILMCTKKGVVKKTSLRQYSKPRINGIYAITIRDKDQLLEAKMTTGTSQVLLANRSGRAIRFDESKVRPMGRTAAGVRGITLADKKDEVVGMVSVHRENSTVLVVSEHGYGKRSDVEDYRMTNRGGKGVKTINITDKTGKLVAIKDVIDTDDLMIINKSGIAIRMGCEGLRVMGRATQGVRLIKLNEDDEIAAVSKIEFHETDMGEEEGEEGESNQPEMNGTHEMASKTAPNEDAPENEDEDVDEADTDSEEPTEE